MVKVIHHPSWFIILHHLIPHSFNSFQNRENESAIIDVEALPLSTLISSQRVICARSSLQKLGIGARFPDLGTKQKNVSNMMKSKSAISCVRFSCLAHQDFWRPAP